MKDGISGTAGNDSDMVLSVLSEGSYPDARCLDGSMGAYYHSPFGEESKSKDWMIYFEGGAWCFTEESCKARSTGGLGSSVNYTASMARSTEGILSDDCEKNPTFCEYNLVYLKYCDGASFTGSKEGTSENGLHYRGFDILKGMISELAAPLSSASSVIITGGSAGGMSVYMHVDYMLSSLESSLPEDATVGAIPLSGFFLDRANFADENVFSSLMRNMYQLHNSVSGVPAPCLSENNSDPASCIFPENAYKTIATPIFVVDSTLDAFQIPCVAGAEWEDGGGALDYSCGGVEGFETCTKLWQYDLDQHCTVDQMFALIEYQGSFMRKISSAEKTFGGASNGAFLYQCYTHVAAQYPSYNKFVIDGKTMQEAVGEWWEGLKSGGGGGGPVIYRDDMWTLDGHWTNPSCTY